MKPSSETFRSSYLYLAGAMFIAGSAVVASKILAGSMPSFLATELGILVGLLFLIPLLFLVKKETFQTDLKTNAILLIQALFGVFLYRIFTFVGLQYTTAANSGLITSCSPVIVALLAFLFLREKLTITRMIGVLVVVVGMLAINIYPFLNSNMGSLNAVKGNLFILLAVLCEALFSILSKVSCKPMSALYRTTIITFYAFILLLPFSVYDGLQYDWAGIELSSVICVLYYGFFVSFLSYVFWFKGIEKVPASNAAVFTSVVPVSSIVLSAVVLKETVMAVHMVGLGCVIGGILISCLGLGRKRKGLI